MHRRLWLLLGAAAAILLVASSATAKVTVASSARVAGATPAAAPFAQAWANVPRTPAGRKAANVVVAAVDEDVNGFNGFLNCCTELVQNYIGADETQQGPFYENEKGLWVPSGVTTSATASATGLSYTISPNAYWYWGGKKIPVTYKDFVYTLQNVVNPKNDIADPSGYGNLDPTHFTHKGDKQVTFFWKKTNCTAVYPCGPYANWQYIFSNLYPAAPLAGMDFNKIWTNCICGSDGKPISDGPYYMSNYTKGQGTTLIANPYYVGKKPAIHELDFKLILDDNSEIQAIRGGEVDMVALINFGQNLVPLMNTPGITFDKIPGYYFEHLELREGNRPGASTVTHAATNPLLAAPWMRQAIMMGIDRQAIMNTIYGPLAAGLTPIDNMIYFKTQAQYKPDFHRWNYNPQKALALLAKHCTGGPTSPDPNNSKIWTCSGYPAKFNWMTTNGQPVRLTSEAIAKAQLKAIGIETNDASAPANVVFSNNGVFGGNYDIAEFAQITNGDPSAWYQAWKCKGTGNYTGFCSAKADKLTLAGSGDLDNAKRAVDYQQADALLAADVPVIPLYQRPTPLIYKSSLKGVVNNPTVFGPTWNTQDWNWGS